MKRVDALVVGGGPAGSTLAALAAGAGLSVLLAERRRFPRDKVCGEFLSAEGCRVLDRVGILQPLLDRGAPRITRFRITDTRGRGVGSRLPDLPEVGRDGLGVSRALMDSALLELARQSGAIVRERWEAVSPAIDGGRVRGMLLRPVGAGGSAEEVHASVVIAADGRRSALLRALHPGEGDPGRTGPRSWFGLKTHFSGTTPSGEPCVDLHQFERGYAGIGEVEDGKLNLCMMVTVATLRACGGSPEGVLRERVLCNPAAAGALEGAGRCGPWKSVGPLAFGVRRPVSHGVLFVGDAAGTIDPFCGEGMSNALRGAELALPFVLRAAEQGALADAVSGAYRRKWLDTFGPVTRRARWLGRLLERPALGRPAVGLLSRAGSRLLPRIAAASRTGP